MTQHKPFVYVLPSDPEALCDALDQHITDLYFATGSLAELLYAQTRPMDTESVDAYLDNLKDRLVMDEVRGHLLAARHELHGGLTALIKARGYINARRSPDGDPNDDTPPCAEPETAERSHRPE